MSPFQTLVILILYIPALIICVKLGNKKGHSDLGWITGLFLGWIGVVIMLLVRKTYNQEVRDTRRRFRVEAEARGEVVPPEDKPASLIAAYREAKSYKEELWPQRSTMSQRRQTAPQLGFGRNEARLRLSTTS